MNKTLSLLIAALLLASAIFFPSRAAADRFFEDNDAFFLKYLKQDKFELDTSAEAIVLYERHTNSVGSQRIRKIIKIIKKSGVSYADVLIPIPAGSHFVNNVHGCTYNLESGKIIKQELSKDNVGMEQTDVIKEEKISMPAVKEGSIIDYSYEIENSNNFFVIATWHVQENIPKLYCRLDVSAPDLYTLDPYDQVVPVYLQVNEDKKGVTDANLPYSYTYQEDRTKGYWVRRNVKAFENEPYLSDKSNYCETMYVYLQSVQRYGLLAEYLKKFGLQTLDTWRDINKIMVHVFFNKPLLVSEQPLKDKARELAGNDTSDLSVAKKIFRYVDDNITSTGVHSIFDNNQLSKVLKDRSGSNADVNLLLIAMLRSRGISCSPVMVATKDNGTPITGRPDFFKYDYLICQLRINGEKYYLDASDSYLPFGVLPRNCLNGFAWVVDSKDSGGVMLTPDMAKDKGLFSVTTTNNSLTDYTLGFKYYYGEEEARDLREEWNEDSTKIKKYIMATFKNSSMDVKLKQYSVQNLANPDGKLVLEFSIGMDWGNSSLVYFNPYLIRDFEQAPFKTATRRYPVDMPYTQNHTFICKLQLPNGYAMDEVPKSGIIKMDDKVQYKNMVSYDKEANTLNIDARLQLQRLNFPVSEYDVLKEFFDKMMQEQQTNIVLKKQS